MIEEDFQEPKELTEAEHAVNNYQKEVKARLAFDDIKNHNWEVKKKVVVENRKVRDESTGQFANMQTTKTRIAGLDLQMYRTEADHETGANRRVEYRKIISLPFYTFRNYFVDQCGFTPAQVARAVWECNQFGVSIETRPIDKKEYIEIMRGKDTPEMREARERMMSFKPEDYKALMEKNDQLSSTPVKSPKAGKHVHIAV